MSELAKRISALSPEKRALLERRLEGRRAAQAPSIPPRDRSVPCPPSFAQQRIWLLEQLAPMYSMPAAVRITGDLDVDVLRRVLDEIVARHEVLRTTFELDGGTLVQRVNQHRSLDIELIDLCGRPHDECDATVEALALQEARRPFDLEHDLLLRVTVVKLAEAEHVALLTTHHIAADGWSFGVLIREIAELYPALCAGHPVPRPSVAVQYADFAVWQREQLDGERLGALLAYWRERLGATPPQLVLPTDRPRPARPSNEGAAYEQGLTPGLSSRIQALADSEGATPFMVLLAAVKILLFRYTGQSDLIVGSTIAGRTLPQTEQMVGCFVNTLVLRTDLGGEPDFRAVLRRVRDTALGAYEHQDLPFEKLVEEIRPQRKLGETPLVQFVVNFENMPAVPLEVPGLTLAPLAVNRGIAHFDLTLTVSSAAQGGLTARWEYNTDLFKRETIAQLAVHLESTLQQLTAAPDRPIRQLELQAVCGSAPLATRGRLSDLGHPAADASVQALFERQAELTPDAEAVWCEGRGMSYSELNAWANRIAHFLRSRKVTPETPVAIFTGRSLETAAAMLGVLKAGAYFIPLDPSYPSARIAFMLGDSAARVVLTRQRLRDLLPPLDAEVVTLDAGWPDSAPGSATNPPRRSRAGNLAYLIYTSGSTGRPKGAMVDDHALAGYMLAAVEAFDLRPDDRILQFASPGFDVVIEEMFPAWAVGAAVVMAEEMPVDPADLVSLIEREGVTAVELPTAYWHEWVYQVTTAELGLPPKLRFVIVGGERVLPDRLARWQTLGIPLVHVYGLTETTVTSTTFTLPVTQSPVIWPNLPVGKPTANTRLYILDSMLRPVPTGAVGEIYIGGPSVARGYFGRPGLTAQRFVADPMSEEPGARIYRTGDLGRFLRSGDIEFSGRVDAQVKVRGFRVEPADIEAVLVRHPGVRESTVVVREDTPGDRRLAAYLVGPPGANTLPPRELREFLGQELPAYMMPSAFVWLDSLPLSPNGKIDRAALPAPRAISAVDNDAAGPAPTAPRGSTEQVLAAIWADVIGLESVGVDDNFFEIGGDSILSIQIVARARQHGLRLTPLDTFRHPTVAEQAEVAIHASADEDGEQDVSGEYPGLPLQRWFFQRGLATPGHWNMAVLLEVRAGYGRDVLKQALRELVSHHDGLRQRFSYDGTVRVRIAETTADVPLDHHDLSGLSAEDQVREIERIGSRAQASLDIARGPVIRAALLDMGAGRPSRLLVVVHHLVVDGVSFRVLLEDFQVLCAQLVAGGGTFLPGKTASVKTWALRLDAHANSAALSSETDYWQDVLAVTHARLPVDFPETAATGGNDVASARTVTVALDPSETAALLRDVPSAYNTQINDVLLAALSLALAEWTAAPARLVELESHGREPLFPDLDFSRTVGWFTATYPVLLEAAPGGGLAGTLKATKERLRAVPHGGIGYGLLRYCGPDDRDLVGHEEPEISFNYLGQFDQAFRGSETFVPATEQIGPRESPGNLRTHLLGVVGQIMGGELRMHWTYSKNVHDEGTVQRLADRYIARLRSLIEHCVAKEAREYTPSDFPKARLSQADLDSFIRQITISE